MAAVIATSFHFGPYRLALAERLLERDGCPMALGGRALDLLIALVERAGEVISRAELMQRVWPGLTVEEGNLRVHIAGLRKTLGEGADGARYIANVAGRGYCFVAPVARAPAAAATALAGPPAALSPPPPRLSRMVGRRQTVAALAAMLREQRFVSVVGPGGMGKTTVAVAVAHELADAFDGQVAFVDIAPLADAGMMVAAVATAIGATLTTVDPMTGLLAFVAERRMLVVLDNCEHLVDAVAVLAEQLHTRAPELHLLVTSREALRTEGEHVHALEPLEGPPEVAADAAELLSYPAVQLFMERAAAGGWREPLDAATAPLVARICRRLDGIALAIELVAARLGTYGVQGTAELLDDRFKLLWQGRRSAVGRHKTLHAMLDWSVNLLSPRDRTILARLALFAGPFNLAAVRAVVAGDGYDVFEAEQALDNLVGKSLVWTVAALEGPLYRLPHVMRDFALTEFARLDERRDVATRHARHILRVLERLAAAPPPASSSLYSCLRGALEWSFSEEGDRELALDLVVAAAPFWLRTGLLGECRHWSERALARLAENDRGGLKELHLQEALAVSVMFTRGNDGVVAAAIERGIALAEALGETRHHLRLLSGQHMFLARAGAFEAAMQVSLRSLAIAARFDSVEAKVVADLMFGASCHFAGRQRDAQRHSERGLAQASANGLDSNLFGLDHLVRTYGFMARCLWLQGRWTKGLNFAGKAIERAERGGAPVGMCVALIYATTVLLWNGSHDEAGALVARLENLAERHALAPYQACARALRGELMAVLGEHEAAVPVLEDALARLDRENHQIMSSRASNALARALTKVGRLDQARTVVDAAIDLAARSGGKHDLSELLRTQAEIRLRTGDTTGAEAALREAVAVADEQGAVSWRLRCGEALASLQLSRGRRAAARAETARLTALLDGCAPSELQTAARERLRALRAAADRSAATRHSLARRA